MPERDYNNTGMIYRNPKKLGTDMRLLPGANPKLPDCRGQATIDGKRYKVSGWLKSGGKGKFTSLVFQPEDDAAAGTQSAQPATPTGDAQAEQPKPTEGRYVI